MLPQLDGSSDRAAFKQIADHLRSEIMAGEYGPGTKLPSETELTDHYGVARGTIRQAVHRLQGEGLVEARHGRGVFVTERPKVVRLAGNRFARVNREAGLAAFLAESNANNVESGVDSIEISEEVPPPEVARRLGIRGNVKTVVRSRRYLRDGKPTEIATSYVPSTIARGTRIAKTDTGPGGIYARIEDKGFTLARFTEQIEARMPTPEEARLLHVREGVPVFRLIRTAFTEEGQAVEVCDTVMVSEAFILEYELPAT